MSRARIPPPSDRIVRASGALYWAAFKRTGLDNGPEAWERWQRYVERMLLLYGLAGAARPTRGARIVRPRAPLSLPAGAERTTMFARAPAFVTAPFVEAVEAYIDRIPGGQDILVWLRRVSEAASAKIRREAEDRARDVLRKRADELIAAGKPAEREAVMARVLATAGSVDGLAERHNTVFRTALQSSLNAGQRSTLRRAVNVMAYRLVEVKDLRTRGNPRGLYPHPHKHWQMTGFVAAASDPIWNFIWPPNGYNCRATVEPLFAADLQRMGLWFNDAPDVAKMRRMFARQWAVIEAGEYPDPGFRASLAVQTGIPDPGEPPAPAVDAAGPVVVK